MQAVLGGIVAFFKSYTLAVITLVALLVITWLGTLYQVEHGILAAQRLYFETWIFMQPLGELPKLDFLPTWISIPLPGAYLLMTLLSINILVGGLVLLRRRLDRVGIAITHIGIVVLIASGALRFHFASDGLVSLYEGQSSDVYADAFMHELVVIQELPDGSSREWSLVDPDLDGANPSRPITIAHPEIPFDVVVERFAHNSHPISTSAPMVDRAWPEGAGEFRLLEFPRETEGGRIDNPGAVVNIRHQDGSEQQHLLWTGCPPGRQSPMASPIMVDGVAEYGIVLRRYLRDLPFHLVVEDFDVQFHPGSGAPSSYMSEIIAQSGDIDHREIIEMNRPMRHAGTVVYQTGWGPSGMHDAGVPLFTILTVADNPADQIPLIACVIISIGLVVHFALSFYRFVPRNAKRLVAEASKKSAAGLLFVSMCLTGVQTAQSAEIGDPLPPVSTTPEQRTQTSDQLLGRPGPWHPGVIDAAMGWPIQENGRVQPLARHAGFLLLRLNGSRDVRVTTPTGVQERLSPTAFYLDLLFYPQQAMTYPIFRIDSDTVVRQLGLDTSAKERRDRYTFVELRPGLVELERRATQIRLLPEAQQDTNPVNRQILDLYDNVQSMVFVMNAGRFIPLGVSSVNPEVREQALAAALTPHLLPPLDQESVEWGTIADFYATLQVTSPADVEATMLPHVRIADSLVQLGFADPQARRRLASPKQSALRLRPWQAFATRAGVSVLRYSRLKQTSSIVP